MKKINESRFGDAVKGFVKKSIQGKDIIDAETAIANTEQFLASARDNLDNLATIFYGLDIDTTRPDAMVDYIDDIRKKIVPYLEEPLEQFKEKVGYKD